MQIVVHDTLHCPKGQSAWRSGLYHLVEVGKKRAWLLSCASSGNANMSSLPYKLAYLVSLAHNFEKGQVQALLKVLVQDGIGCSFNL
eukprot:581332-Amphidinium_carterae.3